MKIAILSDIHGNFCALEAVLKHAKDIGVEYYIVLGDLVGYYYKPDIVVRSIRSLPGVVIQGNHERLLKKVLDKEIDIKALNDKYGKGHQIALQKLEMEEINWLINLPVELDIILDKVSLKICHGSPGEPDRYIYPDLNSEAYEEILNDKYDFIFMGHTHYPFITLKNECMLINVGSVGQSKDVGGLASWGMLDTSNKTYIPYKTPYNKDKLKEDIKNRDSVNKDFLLSVLKRNRYD